MTESADIRYDDAVISNWEAGVLSEQMTILAGELKIRGGTVIIGGGADGGPVRGVLKLILPGDEDPQFVKLAEDTLEYALKTGEHAPGIQERERYRWLEAKTDCGRFVVVFCGRSTNGNRGHNTAMLTAALCTLAALDEGDRKLQASKRYFCEEAKNPERSDNFAIGFAQLWVEASFCRKELTSIQNWLAWRQSRENGIPKFFGY